MIIGSDRDATTVLLDRGGVVEQAVIRDGSVDGWAAFGRSVIDDAYRLRLSASREFGTQVVPVVELLDPEVPIEGPHLTVDSRRTFHPTWSVSTLDAWGRGAESFDKPDEHLARAVASAFPALTRLPNAVTEAPSRVVSAIASVPPPSTVELKLRWERAGRDLAITPSGVCVRMIEGPKVRETWVDWAADPQTTPGRMSQDWDPVPTVRAQAATEDVEVVVVGMASLLALGVRLHNRSDWYVISASPQAIAATTLARSMGLGDADNVGLFTDPKQISISAVTNAAESSVSVRPIGAIEGTSRRDLKNITTDALMAWMPTAKVRAPELKALPQNLRSLLERQFRTALAQTTLDIGAQVEELVTVEGGHVWRHEVKLKPGQKDARRVDSTTHVVRGEGAIDREGHFVASDATLCPYCGARVCEVCASGLVSCDCCDISICRRCVRDVRADISLCPACATMRPPTRSEARHHGRWLSTRGMLIGADEQHVVVVEEAKEGWALHGQDGEKQGIASSSVSDFLSARLSN